MSQNIALYAFQAFGDALGKCPSFCIGAIMCRLAGDMATAYSSGLVFPSIKRHTDESRPDVG